MKLLLSRSKFALFNLFLIAAFPAAADDPNTQYVQQTTTNTQNLVNYLKNLGGYLGYDISQSPKNAQILVSQRLLSPSITQLNQSYLFNTVLGAALVNYTCQASAQFLPSGYPTYPSAINPFANYTFSQQSYSSPSQQQGKISVNPLFDQEHFQEDPVSQAVLNILSTPDDTYCMTYDGTSWAQNCNGLNLLYQTKVMSNVIGKLPDPQTFYTYKYNQNLLSQLNSSSLMSPLLYSTESSSNNSTSSSGSDQQNTGLTAQSQAQQAANFIAYATGMVSPLGLPKWKEYDMMYSNALNQDKKLTPAQQNKAEIALNGYLTSLRVYAAQSSVGISNLYYILSKRMPQKQSDDGSSPAISQAMSEFTMATRRLYNPAISNLSKQWINQINNASPATVQKEMAILLAEINYQLYLNRQQEERMLLTNTMLLIQSTKASQPSADLSQQEAATE